MTVALYWDTPFTLCLGVYPTRREDGWETIPYFSSHLYLDELAIGYFCAMITVGYASTYIYRNEGRDILSFDFGRLRSVIPTNIYSIIVNSSVKTHQF